MRSSKLHKTKSWKNLKALRALSMATISRTLVLRRNLQFSTRWAISKSLRKFYILSTLLSNLLAQSQLLVALSLRPTPSTQATSWMQVFSMFLRAVSWKLWARLELCSSRRILVSISAQAQDWLRGKSLVSYHLQIQMICMWPFWRSKESYWNTQSGLRNMLIQVSWSLKRTKMIQTRATPPNQKRRRKRRFSTNTASRNQNLLTSTNSWR